MLLHLRSEADRSPLSLKHDIKIKGKSEKNLKQTSEPRGRAVEMYASAGILAFTSLLTTSYSCSVSIFTLHS